MSRGLIAFRQQLRNYSSNFSYLCTFHLTILSHIVLFTRRVWTAVIFGHNGTSARFFFNKKQPTSIYFDDLNSIKVLILGIILTLKQLKKTRIFVKKINILREVRSIP